MTHHVPSMLDAYPKDLGQIDKAKLAECIEACFECAQTCTACADACLSEDMVAELTKCIRTNLDCAMACQACADECEKHAGMHEHCKICAEACGRCERACNELVDALG